MNEGAILTLEESPGLISSAPNEKPVKTDLVKNTAFNVGGQVLPLVTGICLMPYIVRTLGPDRFGVLGIVWVLLNYFTLFDIGLGRATTKFLAEAVAGNRAEEIPGLVWTSLVLQAIFGLVGCAILVGLAPVLAKSILKVPSVLIYEAKITLWILAASLPIVLVTNGMRAVLEGKQRFDLSNVAKVPSSMLVFVIPAVALPFGIHLPGILALLWCSRIGMAIAHWVLCLRVLPVLNSGFSFDRNALPRLLTFGGWVTAGNVVSGLLVSLDRFFVGALVSVAAVGFYTAPAEAVGKLLLIPISMAASIFPACSALGSERRRELSAIYFRSTKYLLIGLGPIAGILCIFRQEIIRLWLGPEFVAKSATVLGIFGIAVFVNSFSHIPYSFLHGLGRPDWAAKLFLAELPVYMTLSWWMISRWGVVGAAIAWSLRVGIELVALFVIVWKLFGLVPHESDHQKRGAGVLCILLVLLTGAHIVLAERLWSLAGMAALSLALYTHVIWLLVLNEGERAQIVGLVAPLRFSLGRRSRA